VDQCPKCGSKNVWVGAFPLSCDDCGWNYLNKYPCDVCGGPSFSSYGAGKLGEMVYHHRCREHPLSDEERSALFKNFAVQNDKGG